MGLFDKLFGGTSSYPELDQENPAARRLAGVEDGIKSLTEKTKDRLEVVPAEDKAFVFVGKPPKQFGLVWIKGQDVTNLKNYLSESNIDSKKAATLVDALTEAYQRSQKEQRFRAQLAGRDVVVTPSDRLALEVERILERGASG